MNKFDDRYIIRLAMKSDIEELMQFIDNYWRKDHIMAKDRDLFEYEFVDGDNVNFVIAIDRNTNMIEGIFGFLKCSNSLDNEKKDIWGSLWKVNDLHDNIPLLGIELAKRVVSLTGCRMQIGNGANPTTTVPLRRIFFGEKVTKMKQYYMLNENIEEYRIADITRKHSEKAPDTDEEYSLCLYPTIEEVIKNFDVESIDAFPYKDNWYVNKRYFCHPYYKYNVFGVINGKGKAGALMMTREVGCNGSKVLRIVDYIGDQKLFGGLHKVLYQLMVDNNYEYIDFFTFGFDENAIFNANFSQRTDSDPNIIPNYFEPFFRGNVDIWAHYKYDNTLFFKADGDQDRPNLIYSANQ